MGKQSQGGCSVLELQQFKEFLDHRVTESNLWDAHVPREAVIDARDATLLNNLTKKMGHLVNYNKKLQLFLFQAKSSILSNDKSH